MNVYAALRITDAHPCPHCGAVTGEYCTTSTGNRTQAPHVLRTDMAKRAAVHGVGGESRPCPAGCGDDLNLVLWSGAVLVVHARTLRFECGGPTIPAPPGS